MLKEAANLHLYHANSWLLWGLVLSNTAFFASNHFCHLHIKEVQPLQQNDKGTLGITWSNVPEWLHWESILHILSVYITHPYLLSWIKCYQILLNAQAPPLRSQTLMKTGSQVSHRNVGYSQGLFLKRLIKLADDMQTVLGRGSCCLSPISLSFSNWWNRWQHQQLNYFIRKEWPSSTLWHLFSEFWGW